MSENQIPAIVHHIWLGKGQMPEHQQRWRRAFIDANPGWEFRLWTDETLPPILSRRVWDLAGEVGGTPGCVMRSDVLRLEVLARFGGVYLDTDIKPIRPLDEYARLDALGGPSAWVACEQQSIISNAAMGFPRNHPALWHAMAALEESFFDYRSVGDQAGPGLIARTFPLYDDIALLPPEYFHPTVAEVARNPDGRAFTKAAHVFAGTWLDENKGRYAGMWEANAP